MPDIWINIIVIEYVCIHDNIHFKISDNLSFISVYFVTKAAIVKVIISQIDKFTNCYFICDLHLWLHFVVYFLSKKRRIIDVVMTTLTVYISKILTICSHVLLRCSLSVVYIAMTLTICSIYLGIKGVLCMLSLYFDEH